MAKKKLKGKDGKIYHGNTNQHKVIIAILTLNKSKAF